MKTAILAIILVTYSVDSFSQGVFSNGTNSALEQVLQDYPNRFRNIKGAMLVENTRATNYESSVKIPGSVSCFITQSTTNAQALTWTAEVYSSNDFSEASRRYNELFNQIKNTIVKVRGAKPYILSGQLSRPDQGKPYHSSILSLLPAAGELQKVKVEISLLQRGTTWKLQLSIYDDHEEQLAKNQ